MEMMVSVRCAKARPSDRSEKGSSSSVMLCTLAFAQLAGDKALLLGTRTLLGAPGTRPLHLPS